MKELCQLTSGLAIRGHHLADTARKSRNSSDCGACDEVLTI